MKPILILFFSSLALAQEFPPVGLYSVILETKDVEGRTIQPLTYVLAGNPADAMKKAEETGRGKPWAGLRGVSLLAPNPQVDIYLDVPRGCYE